MPVEIRVPVLGESVIEAVVAKWLKNIGDTIAPGDPVVELETDKVNLEVPAEQGGVLEGILKGPGETVGVGEVLGTLSVNGNVTVPTTAASATANAAAATASASANVAAATATHDDGVAQPGASAPHAADDHVTDHVPATPVARRLAQEGQIDLAGVHGSGIGGRITKSDVAALRDGGQSAPAAVAPPASAVTSAPVAPAAPRGREQRIRMSRRRQTIAKRLVEAQHTAAMLTTFNEVDMSAVMEARKRRKDSFKERYGVGLGFMSFFTKAVIGALKAFPRLNAEIQGDEIVLKSYYDIGIAVGVEEGLVVPVLRDADQKSFAEIEREIAELASRARANTLALSELMGGTFTITNGGVYGSLLSTPILNAPQVGILGMHKIQERPIALNGQVVIKPMMYLALSYDHRIVDGSEAVRFLVRIKDLLEDPLSLMIEG
jgi:2-oxoglutarate dehydrogenase E2 component (dihydrolipoamide succinyltransferase)